MFDHLDDPQPATATAGWHRAVHQRIRDRRRRRHRAGLAAGGLFTAATVAVGAGVVLDRRLQPERVAVEELAGAPSPGEPVTILFVGLDRVRDLAGERSDPVGADTIVVARVDPVAGEVRLLPVPRDLWLDDGVMRINGTVQHGGPQRLVEAVRDELGIEVHHYVQADMAGAAEIVDALGGLRLSVPHRVTGLRSGVDLAPGCQVLGGGEVVALGRARSDVVVHDPAAGPEGRLDESADLGRQQRIAVVAVALLQAVGRVGLDDLPALVDTGLGAVAVDDTLDRAALVEMGRLVAGAELATYTIPVQGAMVGAQMALRLAEGAGPVIRAFLDGSPAPEPTEADGSGAMGFPGGDGTGLAPC